MNKQQYGLMQIIQKIDIFKGLSVEEAGCLLRLFSPKIFEAKEMVYAVGQPSTDLLVLLQGKLVVTSTSGDVLAEIGPGTPIGEMGIFTGHPRSANVVAPGKAGGVVISRQAMDAFLSSDTAIRSRVLQNIVDVLSERLAEANQKIAAQAQRIQELGGM